MDLLLGVAAYLLYYIYDINSVKWKKRFIRSFFLIGSIFLVSSTIYHLYLNWHLDNLIYRHAFLILILGFLGLLIYTLFFAIPFKETYVDENNMRLAYTKGMYALCRHPGMIWYTFLYLSIWGFNWNLRGGIFFGVVTILDLIYIILQDYYIFPRTFSNYADYKKKVPFLIPFLRKKEYTNVKEQILHSSKRELWDKYCYFLDLTLEEYMDIQKKYLKEQIALWKDSQLGQSILKGKDINDIEDFRKNVPLTTYYDYADILLKKDSSYLSKKADIWIQTTWEGGTKPIKVAPYTREMLDTFRDNVMTCLLLCTSKRKYHFKYKNDDNFLYGLAPLPFMTGLFPTMLNEVTDISFLPPVEKAVDMSFKERNVTGFKMAMKDDVHFFFGLGSVAYAITQSISQSVSTSSGGGLKSLMKCKPHMRSRIIKAKLRSKREKRNILPKDLFKLRGFMVAGTDNRYYKDELEALWGTRPMELFAGTEPSLIGSETWRRNGMYFFPNTGLYEFIKIEDSVNNRLNPNYIPKTYLMDEVEVNETYELILSIFHGGAFMRYRVGDVYKCVGKECKEEGTTIPRFEYIDRVPWIIDIAGFTRFSEEEIETVIKRTKLPIKDWLANKELNELGNPVLSLYLEMEEKVDDNELERIIHETFSKFDEDFDGLKNIIGTNPVKITQLLNNEISLYKMDHPRTLKVDSIRDHLK